MIEISVEMHTKLRTSDPEMAIAFLGSIGETQVKLICRETCVFTGADLAKLILERDSK